MLVYNKHVQPRQIKMHQYFSVIYSLVVELHIKTEIL
jgi:hypothetical protein